MAGASHSSVEERQRSDGAGKGREKKKRKDDEHSSSLSGEEGVVEEEAEAEGVLWLMCLKMFFPAMVPWL